MKPSERFKKRYVGFALSVEGKPVGTGEAKSIVHEHFLSLFGELGIAALAFKLVKYDAASGKGILRCERSRLEETIFCMACLCAVAEKKARMEPLSTSGTIRRV